MAEPRLIRHIAREIRNDWKTIGPAANAYLEPMETLSYITDMYLYDSALSVVTYFLSNNGSWRGDTARRIKTELKELCK